MAVSIPHTSTISAGLKPLRYAAKQIFEHVVSQRKPALLNSLKTVRHYSFRF
jgi:hypothetical protein